MILRYEGGLTLFKYIVLHLDFGSGTKYERSQTNEFCEACGLNEETTLPLRCRQATSDVLKRKTTFAENE
jgi:hypothetical protein